MFMTSVQSTHRLQIRMVDLIRRAFSVFELKTERTFEYAFVLDNLPPDFSSSVLDVGCSSSLLPIWMARCGYKVWGVDVREYNERHPNFTFVREDILHTGFADSFFDVITMVSTIEHIGFGAYNDSQAGQNADMDAMKEISRILKVGGSLLITTPYAKEFTIVPGFERYYDDERLKHIFSGWNVESLEYWKPYFRIWKLRFWKPVSHSEAMQLTNLYTHSTVCIKLRKEL
jgi:SAM-dependent methyltransferase